MSVLADVVPDAAEVEAAIRDVDDLVALAHQHTADSIGTGDKDLLDWPEQLPPVLTPAAFVRLVGA